MKKFILVLSIVILLGACKGAQDSPAGGPSDVRADSLQEDSTENLFEVEVNGRYGFIDRTGRMVVQPKFEKVGRFSEGFAIFGDMERTMGFINNKGEIAIRSNENMLFFPHNAFSEGLIPFACYPGERGPFKHKVGYADKKGNIVIEAQFNAARSFSEGLAAVKIGKKWGFIDKTGNLVIKPQFKDAYWFYNGIGTVVIQRGEQAYIDRSGKILFKAKTRQAGRFVDGVAVLEREGKYVFIDKTGRKVFPQEFESADRFCEGLAIVILNGKSGWIDRKGEFVIEAPFEFATRFSEGLARVKTDGRWGYIDKTGKMVIKPKFDKAEDFRDGLARVRLEQDNTDIVGYIDKTGEFVWNSGPIGPFDREVGGPGESSGK